MHSSKLKDENAPESIFKLESPATAMALDDESMEGLVGMMDGGICYMNLKEKLITKLVGAPSHDNGIVKAKQINSEIFATIHQLGGIKLWNVITGEELASYHFDKLNCTDLVYDAARQRIFVFFSQDQIKILSIDDFQAVKALQLSEAFTRTDGKDEYITHNVRTEEDDSYYYFSLSNNGTLFTTEFSENNEVNFIQLFDQEKVDVTSASLEISNSNKTLAVAYNDGSVQTFRFKREGDLYPSLYLLDQWHMMDDPHGELDQKDDILTRFNREVYGKTVKVKNLILFSYLCN